MFLLHHYGNWSFIEAYNLPVRIRKWFLQRTIEQKEKEKKAQEEATSKK
jgi:hypothetical protein